MEGIFRKEGSAVRMRNPWQIFCGLSRIPDTYTVHDVCTLIKRFFGALKRPILGDHQANIMSNVSTLSNERVQAESVCLLFYVYRGCLYCGHLLLIYKKSANICGLNKVAKICGFRKVC
ncbi:unnamed protein product [Meloidogyne enterolobii]|uniref:Uncharacterized protein n=1 Tax=Meloidogyne enterolobii TaxID=390850 RepID=A0ACB0Z334_MELEN